MTETQGTDALAIYDSMVLAIDRCYEVDEVKNLRDRAMAFEHYARQAQNVQAEQKAIEVRVRAERRAGQLLREMERSPIASNPRAFQREKPTEQSPYQEAKTEAKISDTQAHRWQKLAEIPQDDFEAKLRDPEVKPSTTGLIESLKQRTNVTDSEADQWERRAEMPHQGWVGEREEPLIENLHGTTFTPAPDDALRFWGTLIAFQDESEDVHFGCDPNVLYSKMSPAMRADTERLVPKLIEWLQRFERKI